jgi:RNA polymerase sigma-70 factor (ECF subfamily)
LILRTRVTDVDRFYADHRDGVFRYLRRIVGGSDAATDLTQEVFLRVSRAGVPDTTEIGRRAWVFRIARNLALNHVRDGRRRPVEVGLPDAVSPATQELGSALRHAIAALPALERDVFLLREIVGLRYDEIAAACDVTIETVRSRLHQARVALRASLGASLDVRGQRGVRVTAAGPRGGRDQDR